LEVNKGMAWLFGIAAVFCLFPMKIFYWLARRKERRLKQNAQADCDAAGP
jgi:hypothetical protein